MQDDQLPGQIQCLGAGREVVEVGGVGPLGLTALLGEGVPTDGVSLARGDDPIGGQADGLAGGIRDPAGVDELHVSVEACIQGGGQAFQALQRLGVAGGLELPGVG